MEAQAKAIRNEIMAYEGPIVTGEEYAARCRERMKRIKYYRKVERIKKHFNCSYDQAIEMLQQHNNGNKFFVNGDTQKK